MSGGGCAGRGWQSAGRLPGSRLESSEQPGFGKEHNVTLVLGTEAFQNASEGTSEKQVQSQPAGDSPAFVPCRGLGWAGDGPVCFIFEFLGIWPASDAAQCGLDILKSHCIWNSLFKMYRSPGLRPRGSALACLGKAANLLLNKHFLVSLREGFPGACFEKQGRVSKPVPWVQAGLNWIQLLPAFHLGRAVYIL